MSNSTHEASQVQCVSKHIYWANTALTKLRQKEENPRSMTRVKKKVSHPAVIHMIFRYCERSLRDFQQMAAMLRKTFPAARSSQIVIRKIYHSGIHLDRIILVYESRIRKRRYPGWNQACDPGAKEYRYS